MGPAVRCALALAACAAAWMPPAAAAGEGDEARPNIVIVCADDLGINDLACYGRKEHRTPHLDQLAREGMRFTSAYCAQSICSPSRAALLTGKAPARLHLTTYLPGRADCRSQRLLHPRMRQELPLEETTLAEILRRSGYATACIGKWHLGGKGFGPEAQGFDVVHSGRGAAAAPTGEASKGEQELTAAAEEFLAANRERPFFLYLAHYSPHIPLAARPERIAANRGAFHPLYAAVIEALDDAVGRLLRRIDALGLRGQTIVIFTSDNGGLHVPEARDEPPTHNSPYRAGKGFLHEGGLRVPLIARWPGRIGAGAVTAAPVVNTDFLPTLLELAGLEPPADLDGVSFAPLLRGAGEPASRTLYWHFPHYNNQGGRPSGAVREGDWKLVEWYDDGKVELYNLARDSGEEIDLAGREPERAAALRGKLAAWRRAAGAQENAPNPSFDAESYRRLYVDADVSRARPLATAAETQRRLASWRRAMDAALIARPADPAGGAARPNILLLVADDLGHADLGVQGGVDVPTPNLDALAAAGVRCTNGYVSGPYCSPTRAGLLTGRYQQRFGHEFNPHPPRTGTTPPGTVPGNTDAAILGLPLLETTIAERLRAAGYRTGLVGKWHLGIADEHHPLERGFDEFFGFLGGAHPYLEPASPPAAQGPIVGPLLRGRERVKNDGYLTDVLAREAAAFLERHRGEPFFLYLSFNAVHTPLAAPAEYVQRFERISDPRRRTYCAMLAALDAAAGRVFGKLRDLGLEEKTLVFFLSDNGGPTNKYAINGSSNAPLRGGKGDTWEGGVRVPFFAAWKGRLPAGRTHDAPVMQLDIAATALAAAGIEARPEWKLDGVNLLPFLEGRDSGPPHAALFWRFGDAWAVRMGDWKITRSWDNAEPQLFHLGEDPGEGADRKGREPERFAALSKAWHEWNAGLAAPLWPLPEPPTIQGGEPAGRKR